MFRRQEERRAVQSQAKLVLDNSQFVLKYSQFAVESMFAFVDLESIL